MWGVVFKQASLVVQKIMKIQSYVQQAGINEEDLQSMPTFSMKNILAARGRLAIKDRLMQWGITDNQVCPMCTSQVESISHLFFKCQISTQVWNQQLKWQKIARTTMAWPKELNWAENHAKGRSASAEIYRMTLAACVYHIWIERNNRVFQDKQTDHKSIVRKIIQEVFHRRLQRRRLN
ncbi:uncharacterized protein [Nicotiana tomentosiformis]|uniref:uncharacterized protein n=1 Tax=Nicotiana tomentosiformis TaxID=4098 RepID=UPI00388CD9F2